MTRYAVTPSQISAELNGSTIILQKDAGEYFGLNETGTRIWAMLLKEPKTIEEITSEIAEAYEIGFETCRNDVEALINELVEEKLLQTKQG